MAKSTPSRTLADPKLVQPSQHLACGVGGATLTWEAVPGATSYIVRVMSGTNQGKVVLEEAVSQTTVVVAREVLEMGASYTWSVLATDGTRESAGANSQSFTVVAQDNPQAKEVEPIDTPVHDAHDSPYATEEEAQLAALGAEPESFPIRPVLASVVVVVVSVVVIIVGLFMWTDVTHRQVLSSSAPNSISRYPALKAVEDAATRSLTQYEVLNDAQGIYQVPIDRVLTIMDNEAAQSTSPDQIVLPGMRR